MFTTVDGTKGKHLQKYYHINTGWAPVSHGHDGTGYFIHTRA